MIKEMIREILREELLGLSKNNDPEYESGYKGHLVLVRTYSAGVHFGKLERKTGKEVVLSNAHRVFYWSNACSLSQLAMEASGELDSNNKISMAVLEICLTEAIEIIPISNEIFKKLTSKIWKK